MPPLRYAVLISPLVLFLWLIGVQQPYQPLPSANAQSVPDVLDFESALQAPLDLEITLTASNDSVSNPQVPKKIGEIVTFTATVTNGSAEGLTFFWNFGNGDTAQGRVVRYVYDEPGLYSAFVIATDGVYSKRASTLVVIAPDVEVPEAIEGLVAASDSPTVAGNPTNFWNTLCIGGRQWLIGLLDTNQPEEQNKR